MIKSNFKKINSKPRHQQIKLSKKSSTLIDLNSMHKTIDRSVLTVSNIVMRQRIVCRSSSLSGAALSAMMKKSFFFKCVHSSSSDPHIFFSSSSSPSRTKIDNQKSEEEKFSHRIFHILKLNLQSKPMCICSASASNYSILLPLSCDDEFQF